MKTLTALAIAWIGTSLGYAANAAPEGPITAWTFDGMAEGLAAHGADDKLISPRFVDSTTVPGIQGKALALGVKAGDAEYLTGAAPQLGADYTIEAWVNPTELSDWNRLVLNWGTHTKYAYHFALHNSQVSLCHGLSGGRFVMCEGGNLLPNQWQQIVGVAARNPADPAKSMLKVFLNGQLVGTVPFDGTVGDGGTEPLCIGDSASLSHPDSRYRGYLDAVTMWVRPLTDAEISARYETRRAELEKLYRPAPPSGTPAVGEIVFAERHPGRDPSSHYYANFGYACTDTNEWLHGADGGRLAILNPATGKARTLFADPRGAVRDPQVHYDGQKILFSYRKGGTHHYNLYEINAGGSGLKQLTFGDWDDVEPTYLPDGGIAFCSSRCKRYVLCWLAPVAVLFRCNADGSGIRQLSSGSVTENTPCVLPDGRILYTRWEYVNRDAVSFHHLWTMNPDGTGPMTYFGNMHPGEVFTDARPVPGTSKVVYIDSGYHGSLEHTGNLFLLDLKHGPDDRSSARHIAGGGVRDPFPLSESAVLAARGNEIIQIDTKGKSKVLYKSNMMVHEPRLLAPHPREMVIPSRVDLSQSTGTLFLNDVTIGRNMANVKPGAIKKLLVMEDLPKPVNFHGGGTTPIAHGGTWTLKRILGTVPVEPDGSAFFEAPACRSIYFVALDDHDLCVKQMRSFVTLQPGEHASCIGCHDNRISTSPPKQGLRLAARRAASHIEPIDGIPQTLDFPRDIQPILDRHCIRCHNADKRAGGIELTGDHGPTYSLAYYNLMLHHQITDNAGLNWVGIQNVGGRPAGNDVPYTTYSFASPLMKKIDGSHHNVKLTDLERATIRLWIDSAAVYAGTYAAYGTGQIGAWWRNNQPIREMDTAWPSTAPARDAINRRCAACHQSRLPNSVTAQTTTDPHGDFEGWMRPTSRFSRHTIFNLSHPEKSLALMATLSKSSGGFAEGAAPTPKPIPNDLGQIPKPVTHPVIFTTRDDPDYQRILTHLQAAKTRLEEIKRFDMPGFQPRYEYIREMKRYGVLPADFDPTKETINPYEIDQRYWQQFWSKPSSPAGE